MTIGNTRPTSIISEENQYSAKSLKKYQTETAEIERDRLNQIDQLEDEIKNVKNQNCQLQRENDELRNRQKIQIDEVQNKAENKLNSERENYINEIRGEPIRLESGQIYFTFGSFETYSFRQGQKV